MFARTAITSLRLYALWERNVVILVLVATLGLVPVWVAIVRICISGHSASAIMTCEQFTDANQSIVSLSFPFTGCEGITSFSGTTATRCVI